MTDDGNELYELKGIRMKSCRSTYVAKASKVGSTHKSVVVGLKNPDSDKWRLFLKDGPYWNYLVGYLDNKPCLCRHKALVEDAVNEAIAKVSRFMISGKFVYKEEGKGCFRAFLKTVALRTALDLLRKEVRHEGLSQHNPHEEERRLQNINEKINARPRRELPADGQEADNIWDDVDDDDDTKLALDKYDASAFGDAKDGCPRQDGGDAPSGHFARFNDIMEGDDDPADVCRQSRPSSHEFEEWMYGKSEDELRMLQRMQINVLHIALGQILEDKQVSPLRRQILKLLLVDNWTLDQIWECAHAETPELRRNTFDKRVHDAREVLRKRAIMLWRLVMPDGEEADERKVYMLWASLSNKAANWNMVKKLKKQAEEQSVAIRSKRRTHRGV